MKIKGVQKLTLLDYPGKMAATIFIGGCNFRCPFCHNAGIVVEDDQEEISKDALFSFLQKRKHVLQGVCITGGEPLLYEETEPLIRGIKELGYKIKLDTNGSFPKRLKKLVRHGLVDYVAMDLKNSKEKYMETAGTENFELEAIEESVSFLLEGHVDFEFRTTIVKELHTMDDIKKMAQWIKGAGKYFLQPFVDSGELIEDGFSAYEEEEMREFARVVKEFVPNVEIRGL